MVEFKDILQYGHTELAMQFMAPGYMQHNMNVPGGRDNFIKNFSTRPKLDIVDEGLIQEHWDVAFPNGIQPR